MLLTHEPIYHKGFKLQLGVTDLAFEQNQDSWQLIIFDKYHHLNC